MREEVEKLEETEFINEVMYPQWLINYILVKKANGKYRICIDFSDLNQVCPKNYYPFQNINKMINFTIDFDYSSFLDAMLGYHQIPWTNQMKRRLPS